MSRVYLMHGLYALILGISCSFSKMLLVPMNLFPWVLLNL